MPVGREVERARLRSLGGTAFVVGLPVLVLTLYAVGALSTLLALASLFVVGTVALLARLGGAWLVLGAAALLTLHELAFSKTAPQWAQGVALIALLLLFLSRSPSAPLSRASTDARPDRGSPL